MIEKSVSPVRGVLVFVQSSLLTCIKQIFKYSKINVHTVLFVFAFVPWEPSQLKKNKYEIVVIGAGPAGSITARDLARLGYDVLHVEKRPIVGIPVRCGEATTTRERLSQWTSVNDSFIETDLHGAIIYAPFCDITYTPKKNVGLVLDREIFDKYLSDQVPQAGAEQLLNCRVSDISPYKNGMRELKIVHDNEEHIIHSKMVVAADGAESLCAQFAGLKTRQLPAHTCSAIDIQVKGVDQNPNHLTFWVAHKDLPKGYLWVFPKVKSGLLNIGAGTITPKGKAPNMYDVTMKFLEENFPSAEILKVHGGAVPVSGNLEETVADGFLTVGDAAHHTNPISGGGIASGMLAATIAAQNIDQAFQKNDFSVNFLKQYDQQCWERFGKSHLKQMRVRDFIFTLSDRDYEKFFLHLKGLAESNLSLSSKLIHFPGLLYLALKNRKSIKKVIAKTAKPHSYKK